MVPHPQDSDDDPDDMFAVINDDDDYQYVVDEDQNVIILDENDSPGLDEAVEDLDFEDAEEENGFIPDDSKMVFQKHEGSVFCLGLSAKDKKLLVTGGEDDKGIVFNIADGEVLFECCNHKDSVISCGFSTDGKYVMTADMGGMIFVRNVHDGKTAWDFDCSDIEWCKWHPTANVVFAGTAEGDVYMWKIPSGECKIYPTHGSKSTCCCLTNTGKELLSGYEDGSLKLWDLKNVTAVFHHKDGDDPVLCVASQSSGTLFAFGTQSGVVKLVNSTTGKYLTTLGAAPPHALNEEEQEEILASTESIAFSSNGQYLASTSLAGKLYIWDLNTQKLRHECEHTDGVSHVMWLKTTPHVVLTTSLDGVIWEWDVRDGSLMKKLHGHRGHVLDLALTDDSLSVVTAGDDGTTRIYDL